MVRCIASGGTPLVGQRDQTSLCFAILAPMIKRDILYRLLRNGQGARLRQMALQDIQTQCVAKAIRFTHFPAASLPM